MARNDSDNLTSFLLGLFCGVAGGAMLGILFAPKSGDALREDMKDFVHAHPMSKDEHNESGKTEEHNADGHKHDDEKMEAKTVSASEVAESSK